MPRKPKRYEVIRDTPYHLACQEVFAASCFVANAGKGGLQWLTARRVLTHAQMQISQIKTGITLTRASFQPIRPEDL